MGMQVAGMAAFCLMASGRLKDKETEAMTAITVSLPPDVIQRIDELRELELLSRSNWLRREVVLAVRETMPKPNLMRMEPEGLA